MKFWHILIIDIAGMVALFFAGFVAGNYYHSQRHPTLPAPAAAVQIDTVRIMVPSKPVIIVKQGPARIQLDTLRIYATVPDPDLSQGLAVIKVASLDTTVAGVGRAAVDYFFPPVNKFDFIFQPIQRRDSLIIQTVYVPQIVYKQRWYQKDWLWFAAGATATCLVADHFQK